MSSDLRLETLQTFDQTKRQNPKGKNDRRTKGGYVLLGYALVPISPDIPTVDFSQVSPFLQLGTLSSILSLS